MPGPVDERVQHAAAAAAAAGGAQWRAASGAGVDGQWIPAGFSLVHSWPWMRDLGVGNVWSSS